MPETVAQLAAITAQHAPAAECETLGSRLSAGVLALRTSIEQLIAATAVNPQLYDQALKARWAANEIIVLLDDLEEHATNHPA